MRWTLSGPLCLGVVVLVVTTACGGAAAPPAAIAAPGLAAVSAPVRCGRARWAVKTLSDPEASLISVSTPPVETTIGAMIQKQAPTIGQNTGRIVGVETTIFTLVANLKEMSEENDLDIHLVIADAAGQTMIAEFPNDDCQGVDHSAQRAAIGVARNAFTQACGVPPSGRFVQLSGTATLSGVGFFDEIHGQQGVAPNGIELHPVTGVTNIICQATVSDRHHPSPTD